MDKKIPQIKICLLFGFRPSESAISNIFVIYDCCRVVVGDPQKNMYDSQNIPVPAKNPTKYLDNDVKTSWINPRLISKVSLTTKCDCTIKINFRLKIFLN